MNLSAPLAWNMNCRADGVSANQRIIAILICAVVACNSGGDALLRVGLNTAPPTEIDPGTAYLRAIVGTAALAGILFLACGFLLELSLLSRADLSFVRPFTATTYIAVMLIGAFGLNEHVSAAHWCGAVLIVCGAFVVSRTRPLTSRSPRL